MKSLWVKSQWAGEKSGGEKSVGENLVGEKSVGQKFFIIEESLEVKLPTIWTDEKQRWEESERREE